MAECGAGEQQEKTCGADTSIYVSVIQNQAKGVVRIEESDLGTGFFIEVDGKTYLITAGHVVDAIDLKKTIIRKYVDAKENIPFRWSELIENEGGVTENDPADFAAFPLKADDATNKLFNDGTFHVLDTFHDTKKSKNKDLYILGHPEGKPMKLNFGKFHSKHPIHDFLLYHSVGTYGGSSGSPVFEKEGKDEDLNVIAMHHTGDIEAGENKNGATYMFYIIEKIRGNEMDEAFFKKHLPNYHQELPSNTATVNGLAANNKASQKAELPSNNTTTEDDFAVPNKASRNADDPLEFDDEDVKDLLDTISHDAAVAREWNRLANLLHVDELIIEDIARTWWQMLSGASEMGAARAK